MVRDPLERLATLHELADILNREPDPARAAAQALERLVALLGLEAGWAFLSDVRGPGDAAAGRAGGFSPAAATGLPPALADDPCALEGGGCECQGMLRRGELDGGANVVRCSRLAGAEGDTRGLVAHASAPLQGREGPVGILNLAAPGNRRFDADELALLDAVGRMLGAAFERARLLEAGAREARWAATLEERQRIARGMHDALAQLLFAADLRLQVARDAPDDAARDAAVAGASELVGAALDELRALVEVLRPPDLEGGLEPALARLAARATPSAGDGPVVVFERAGPADGEPEGAPGAPEEVEEALYRVAQEAVHNALRHARATRVRLRLEPRPDALHLTVEDDGVGMPAPSSPAAGGLGIAGMRERVAAVGGELRIGPRARGGTRVEARVPRAAGGTDRAAGEAERAGERP